MVRERKDFAGFGPRTTKEGIDHVQPTADILSRILAVQLYLDESEPDNGPLRVIPSSHKHRRLSTEQISAYRKEESVHCLVPRGGTLLMRPLAASCLVCLYGSQAEKSDPP